MPASGSSSKSKTSGMRILWIPGGRKSHPKGRFDATNKRVTHTGGQKKSQVWSLGGNRAQADLLRAEPDTSLLDGPSVSRLAPATYLSAGSAAVAVASTSSAAAAAAAAAEQANENKSQLSESPTNIPCTPNSTTSTAPLISLPHSPQPDSSLDSADEMPTQTTTKPVIITTTTTAEIILDENRFSLLGKDLSNDEDNLLELPNVPKDLHNGGGEEHKQSETLTLNSSSGTNASTAETSPLTTSPKSDDGIYATPTRKKHYRHHNNHQQEDVNSIESITENNTPTKVKVPNEDLSFLDDVQANPTNANVTEKNPQRNGNVMINLNGSVKLTNDDDEPDQNTKRVKKKKNKLGKTKELDQLDGVVAIQKTATKTSNYNNNNNNSTEKKKKKEANEKEEPEDEKFVQCLYYTLMCCDCTIS